jgi:hypothetical protein
MPANGLAFAAPHLRYRSVSSNEAARSHPFISGIIASVSRSFRPRSAAVNLRQASHVGHEGVVSMSGMGRGD